MKKTRIRWAIAPVVGLVAALMAALPASAQAPQYHQRIATFFPVFDSCTGEVVDFSGYVDWLISSDIDPSGSIHFVVQTNLADFSGVGETSGIKYQGTGHGGSVLNVQGPFPMEFTNNMDEQMISQGSAPNLTTTFKDHMTINADGSVTATYFTLTNAC